MPENIEPSAITTAGHYILVHHLVRPLTQLDKSGRVQEALAKSWTVSVDKLNWKINLKKEYFSDGTLITANDVAESIKRQMRLKAGVHFNFTHIKKVLTIDESSLEITLVSPLNDFLFSLSKPEFGVLFRADQKESVNGCEFKITSGAYSIASGISSKILLKQNQYFNEKDNMLDLELGSSRGPESIQELKSGTLDFFVAQDSFDENTHLEFINSKQYKAFKPNLSFSYWFSINPKSNAFIDLEERAFFQETVNRFDSSEFKKHTWQKSFQLYSSVGPGRLNENQVQRIWRSIHLLASKRTFRHKPKIKILSLRKNDGLISEVLSYLSGFYQIEVLNYKSEEELVKIISENSFDVKISSNDFSNTDLTENIKTTFNEKRPYIFLDEYSEIKTLLQDSMSTDSFEKKFKNFEEIAKILLEEGLIAPLAYQYIWFYHKSNFDISDWSSSFPEISFWKVKKS